MKVRCFFLRNFTVFLFIKKYKLLCCGESYYLQIFNINLVDKRLDFITVLVTNNDKIFYDNKHYSKYIVGIHKPEVFRNVVNYDIFHNIHKLKIVNRIKVVGFL